MNWQIFLRALVALLSMQLDNKALLHRFTVHLAEDEGFLK